MTAPATSPLLDVEGLTLQYETPDAVILAVYRATFQVSAGERFMILGRSGCGKSTLLKAIGGFIAPAEGRILLAGKPVRGPGPDRMIVWQDADQLLPWKTVRQNVLYPMQLTGVPVREARERADGFLRKVDLIEAAGQYPHELSGGMKMRAAIARGLAMHPAMLLLDEPFGALDALTRTRMQDELLRLQEETGATVLFVTHDIAEAAKLGTRILVLSPHPGQVLANLDASRHGGRDALVQLIGELIRGAEAPRRASA